MQQLPIIWAVQKVMQEKPQCAAIALAVDMI